MRDIQQNALYPSARIYFLEVNRGKGAAIREGIRHASGDIVLIQDADLEYDPARYPILLEPILEGRADVVLWLAFSERAAACPCCSGTTWETSF